MPKEHRMIIGRQSRYVKEPPKKAPKTQSIPQNISQKLGIRRGSTICLINPPEGFYGDLLPHLPLSCRIQLTLGPKETSSYVLLWPETPKTLESIFSWIRRIVTNYSVVWVFIRDKNTLTKNFELVSIADVRKAGLQVGLIDQHRIESFGKDRGIQLFVRREPQNRRIIPPKPSLQPENPQ